MKYIIIINLVIIILGLNTLYDKNVEICEKLDRIIKLLEVENDN